MPQHANEDLWMLRQWQQAGLCVTYHDQCDWEKNPVTYLRVEMQRRAAIETGQWGISQRARRKALRGIGGHDGSTRVA